MPSPKDLVFLGVCLLLVLFVAYQFSLLVETSWKSRHESGRPLAIVIAMAIFGLAILAAKAGGYV